MEFSTVVFALLFGALPVYYVVMILRDIYFVKSPEDLISKPEETDVDISDEAGQFQPILIDKDATAKNVRPVKEAQGDQSIVAAPEAKAKEAEDSKEPTDENGAEEDGVNGTPVPPDSVSEPLAGDEQARKRIQELVKIKRRQMQAEETAAEKFQSENKPKPSDTNAATDKTEETGAGKKTTTKKSSKSPSRSRPIPAYFYYKASVETQATVYCGGQTAEKLSEEVRRVSADKVEMVTKIIESEWGPSNAESRELDEDEKTAIEMAKRRSPKSKIPTCNF
jgi:hypothetical protein